jgi:hypothetical protein
VPQAVQDTQCPERLRLSEIVVNAVDAIYTVDSADKAKARSIGRKAVKELDAHRKEHGC